MNLESAIAAGNRARHHFTYRDVLRKQAEAGFEFSPIDVAVPLGDVSAEALADGDV